MCSRQPFLPSSERPTSECCIMALLCATLFTTDFILAILPGRSDFHSTSLMVLGTRHYMSQSVQAMPRWCRLCLECEPTPSGSLTMGQRPLVLR